MNFKIATEQPKTKVQQAEAVQAHFPLTFYKSEKKTSLYGIFGKLIKDHSLVAVSFNSFNAIDVLVYLLEQTGPAKVCLTSYAIAENTIRTILKLHQENVITGLNLLLDNRVVRECPKAYQLVSANFNQVALTKIHAKIITIENNDWSIMVSSSANLNENPRIESYVIMENKKVTESTVKWIEKKVNEPI